MPVFSSMPYFRASELACHTVNASWEGPNMKASVTDILRRRRSAGSP